MAAQSDIQLRNVTKTFQGRDGETVAVDNVSIDIHDGEFFALLGPSGCGKTTTLRMIAGFEQPTSGEIRIRGQAVQGVPAFHRPVNTVFQDYALFPHMTALQNIAFGLEMKGSSKKDAREQAAKALDLVRLPQVANRKPRQMSGGQQQRVALARALVNEPAVLLLDEPLGALDLKLRKAMQFELKELQLRLGITFIYVTHDQEEALTMADRIAVMSDGVVKQIGTPSEIYETPDNRFVADFIGETNFIPGKLVAKDDRYFSVEVADGLTVDATHNQQIDPAVGEDVFIAVRPERINVVAHDGVARKTEQETMTASQVVAQLREEVHSSLMEGEIVQAIYIGTDTRYIVRVADKIELVARMQNLGSRYDVVLEKGDSCYVFFNAENTRMLTE